MQPWASCLHKRVSVTKQYKQYQPTGGDARWLGGNRGTGLKVASLPRSDAVFSDSLIGHVTAGEWLRPPAG